MTNGPRLPPVALLACAAALQKLLSPNTKPIRPTRTAVASLTAAASVGLVGSSIAEFRRSRTTVNPVRPDDATALVTAGPHRLTRNPMYVGMVGALAAHAVARGNWAALLPAVGFAVAIDRGQIPAEEAALRKQFGPAYDQYADAVPRWLGISKR